MPSIADNIADVQEKIARAAQRAGRDPDEITLVAVTKTVERARIQEALNAGVTDLGENYFQEARDKLPLFSSNVRWHFIGHLQTNKAKYVAGRFVLVQSVDSEELGRELGRRAEQGGIVQDVLIEVKLDPATTKFGVEHEQTIEMAQRVGQTPGLRLRGLMGMAPFSNDPEAARPSFQRLRALFRELPVEQREILSMGMTGDFETAIEEGSTLVRIGTAIFGTRR
jgi:PLP dependent protein